MQKRPNKIALNYEISSTLELGSNEARQLLTMAGVNKELSPFLRMTAPNEWAALPIYQWPAGRVLFSSWILLFGFIPIDRHQFYFQSIEQHTGFIECSCTFTNKRWYHRRSIEVDGSHCRVTDTLAFQTRLPLLGYIFAPIYRLVFKHRHKVLRKAYRGIAQPKL